MTQERIIQHWKKGAQDSIEVAELCMQAEKYEHALFHCHLAVEKALKAEYIYQFDAAAPFTHELHKLADTLSHTWSKQEVEILGEMSKLATKARYAHEHWSAEQATKTNAEYWYSQAQYFLSTLL